MSDLQNRPADWMSTSPIKGLVALIVGGGSGIGEATSQVLAKNGSLVYVADLRMDMAQNVADAINADGGTATAIAMDVSTQTDIDAAVARIEKEHGRLDILINSAGVILPDTLVDASLEKWRLSFTVNVEGALILARSCLPLLRKSDVASIVNISSLAGSSGGYPNGGAYGPSKAALVLLTKTMAVEWAEYGVRANVVSPGTIDTPLTRANMTPEVMDQRRQSIPLGRLGVSSELADLVVFLASPMASFVTAQEIKCDGGLSQALMVQKFHGNK